jgi:hypothetical protein
MAFHFSTVRAWQLNPERSGIYPSHSGAPAGDERNFAQVTSAAVPPTEISLLPSSLMTPMPKAAIGGRITATSLAETLEPIVRRRCVLEPEEEHVFMLVQLSDERQKH